MKKVAYLTQTYNPERPEGLENECPWTAWEYNEGDPVPSNAIIVTEEEYNELYSSFERKILRAKDKVTMQKRAEHLSSLIGDIGANNKQRIRDGVWTVSDLVSLTQDPLFIMALNDINSLSFELAQSKIMAMTNPLVTDEIKQEILNLIQEKLFL